jgi:hypothetical protein
MSRWLRRWSYGSYGDSAFNYYGIKCTVTVTPPVSVGSARQVRLCALARAADPKCSLSGRYR